MQEGMLCCESWFNRADPTQLGYRESQQPEVSNFDFRTLAREYAIEGLQVVEWLW
jgi:hypothetical protein